MDWQTQMSGQKKYGQRDVRKTGSQRQDFKRVWHWLSYSGRSQTAARGGGHRERRGGITQPLQGTLRQNRGRMAWVQARTEPHLQHEPGGSHTILHWPGHYQQVGGIHKGARRQECQWLFIACLHLKGGQEKGGGLAQAGIPVVRWWRFERHIVRIRQTVRWQDSWTQRKWQLVPRTDWTCSACCRRCWKRLAR